MMVDSFTVEVDKESRWKGVSANSAHCNNPTCLCRILQSRAYSALVDNFMIEEGEVRVVPEGSGRYMRFMAGDLVRYPKWFEAGLFFNDFYQERYSFRAYGED